MLSRLIIVGLFGFLVLEMFFLRFRLRAVCLLLVDIVDLNEFNYNIFSLLVTFLVAKFGDLG